jgi:hypothetical protein
LLEIAIIAPATFLLKDELFSLPWPSKLLAAPYLKPRNFKGQQQNIH